MELLSEKVISSRNFEILQLMFQSICTNQKHLIQYSNFKEILVAFVEKIMSSYLEDTKYYKDKYSCVIKDLPSYRRGEFNPEDNVIIINEKVINDIYLGKFDAVITIFHELNHFKSEYDIKLGKINSDIIRTIKDDLLRASSQDPFSETKNIKSGYKYINDDYYKCNYTVFSDEKIAEINAINNYISFMEIIGIKLSKYHLQQLEEQIKSNMSQYNNYLRDLRFIFNFNNYFLDFEKAFDIMIKHNPNWLSISQLKIEYYLDENGKVKKRTKEELEERLKIETDENIKEYIQYLLKPNVDKRLSRSEFSPDIKKINVNEFNYIPMNSNKNIGFRRK